MSNPAEPAVQITNLSVAHLQAIARFSSSDKTRYVLSGVLVEVDSHRITLVATDGRRLIAARFARDCPEQGRKPMGFIIPARVIDDLRKDAVVHLTVRGRSIELLYAEGDVTVLSLTIDGVFPDWRQVTAMVSPEPFHALRVNSEFFDEFAPAFKTLTGDRGIICCGSARGVYSFRGMESHVDCIGVLMGVKERREEGIPEWCRNTPAWAMHAAPLEAANA